MPRVCRSLQRGLLVQTHRFCEEKQWGETKPSKKKEVVQGTSASPDQTPALTAGWLWQHWGCSRGESKTSLGREEHSAKDILCLV